MSANSRNSFATVLLIFGELANFSRKPYASEIVLREILAFHNVRLTALYHVTSRAKRSHFGCKISEMLVQH